MNDLTDYILMWNLKEMKSSDAKASKCHLKFSSLMMQILIHLTFFK